MLAARGSEDVARQLDAEEELFVDRSAGRLLLVDEYPMHLGKLAILWVWGGR